LEGRKGKGLTWKGKRRESGRGMKEEVGEERRKLEGRKGNGLTWKGKRRERGRGMKEEVGEERRKLEGMTGRRWKGLGEEGGRENGPAGYRPKLVINRWINTVANSSRERLLGVGCAL